MRADCLNLCESYGIFGLVCFALLSLDSSNCS